MICTESEAKTKWCPQTRLGSEYSGIGSLNRDCTGKSIPANCIGSACMLWDWVDPECEGIKLSMVAETFDADLARLKAEGWVEDGMGVALMKLKRQFIERRGTCGLIRSAQ